MSVRSTIQLGNPGLKTPKKAVINISNQEITQVTNDLIDTMRDQKLIGMAAHQIGAVFDIFVTEPRETDTRPADESDQLRVFINSRIIFFSPEKTILYEGCGSVVTGQLFGPVERSRTITIEAEDEKGKVFHLSCNGILARVIQHELDHLNGVSFIEKVVDYSKLIDREYYVRQIKNMPEYLAASKTTVIECTYIR